MSRNWVFTCFSESCIKLFDEKLYNNEWLTEVDYIRYIIIGKEVCPSTNKVHLQGYAEFYKPIKMKRFQTLFPGAHCEKRAKNAKREDNRKYCSKDGNYIELGNWEAGGQGTRNDLKNIMKKIKDNTPLLEIFEEDPETISRNLRFVNQYKAMVEKEQTKEFRNVEVIVHVGDAGSGKTKAAFEADPNIFTVNTEDSFPFDGYDGEETILIDDFYGGMKYHQLLRVLDGYQYRCNIKGGHRYAKWKKIFITSNDQPENWYSKGMTPALKRRITKIVQFPSDHKTQHSMSESILHWLSEH